MAITPFTANPHRSDPDNFPVEMDVLVAELIQFIPEVNQAIDDMNVAAAAPGMTAASTSSLTVGTGSKSLTVETGKQLVPGMEVVIAFTTTPTNRMIATVDDYNSGTGALDVTVSKAEGSGTFAAWTVSLTVAFPITSFVSAKPARTASGSITLGKVVALNDDGTVSQIAPKAIGAGTPVSFPQDAGSRIQSVRQVYDSGNDRTVILYQQVLVSTGLYAVVLNNSGGTPVYGTPVLILSGLTTDNASDISYDEELGKVLVVYRDTSDTDNGKGIVGTVDTGDDSISFGSATTFTTGVASDIACEYDSVNKAHLVAWNENATTGDSKVATISGTSVSFGALQTFNGTGSTKDICLSFNSFVGKFLVAYRDEAETDEGRSMVGTISGTSASYGSEYTFANGINQFFSSAFSTVDNVHVITYKENTSSDLKAIAMTINGTSVNAGAAIVVDSGGGNSAAIDYDPIADKFLVVYRDQNNSGYGTAVLLSLSAGTTINNDNSDTFRSASISARAVSYDPSTGDMIVNTGISSNSGGETVRYSTGASNKSTWFGIALEAANDTEECLVATIGEFSPDQTGLVVGATYYVDDNGDLTQTNTGEKVGKAFSATHLLITEANAA
ncbi:hypothetical protein HBA55_34835 [Pseudomaricurvus alkylphenolicus]|uniref:hypothetical protein n=1 Tax=Pseudomaricurvus alkylphenolicus TaxID=1306991 RepID=UPI00142064EF|nr:hypothetical protein [Pseudomaricurvus alkylphenolicus]NIB44809.1 hypothetical protein [Pseudomaricurvus alkylphenolicus]